MIHNLSCSGISKTSVFPSNNNKFSLVTFIFLSLAGTLPLFTSCSSLQNILSNKPKFQFHSAEFAGIDSNALHMKVNLNLKNNYPFPLLKSSLHLDVLADENKITSLLVPVPETGAGKVSPLSLSIDLPLAAIVKITESCPEKESMFLNFNGGAKISVLPASVIQTPGNADPSVFVPFAHSEEIPVFVPVIEITDLSIVKPDLINSISATSPSLDANLIFIIKNSGKAQFRLDQPDFKIMIEGKEFAVTSVKKITDSGRQSQVNITASIPVVQAGAALLKSVTSRKVNYTISGKNNIIFSSLKKVQTVPLQFSKTGSFSWN